MFAPALTLAVVAAAVGVLTFTRLAPDVVLLSGLAILVVAGVVPFEEGFAGFANEGVWTVAALYVVAEAVRQTGAVTQLLQWILGKPESRLAAQTRVLLPAAAFSAFLNNTPVVAMYLPVLADWAKRLRLSVSHLFLPLSYATILGGLCTIIGTSTTVVVNGYLKKLGHDPIGFFEIGYAGLPCAVAGIAFLLLATRWLVPQRKPAISAADNPREYTVEMQIPQGSPLHGKTIQQAGLRQLPNLYLTEVERDGNLMTAVGPEVVLERGDRLVFVGAVGSVVDLQKVIGLEPATDQVFKLDSPRRVRCLIEAVVSNTSEAAGRTIRESQFRTRYKAAVIAVARNGERLPGKIGDIRLRAGDTLLIEADPAFYDVHRDDRDFFLVSRVDDSAPLRHEKATATRAILLAMIAAFALKPVLGVSQAAAAFVAAGLAILLRCVRVSEARNAIDLNVLVTMAAGVGVGVAMDRSGAAAMAAGSLTSLGGDSPRAALAAVYGVTMLLTNLITAKAAGPLMLTTALATAETLGTEAAPFAVAVMIAAAACFATPFGYQTNLMVYGPGGYRAGDFVRLGGPLSLVVFATAMLVVPAVWPL